MRNTIILGTGPIDSDPEANALSNSDPGTFDASAFIDPANCDGTGLPLAFHWFITYPQISAITNPYTIAGITGYRKAVLYIKANTMVAQFSPPVDFKLIVTSPETGLSTEVDILSQVTETGLGLPEYNSCRGQSQVGPLCENADWLPTTEPTVVLPSDPSK